MPAGNPFKDEDHGYSFIMLLLSTCDSIKPDYHQMARMTGSCSANLMRAKFRNWVKHGGYDLVKDKVVRPDSEGDGVPATPRKRPRSKKDDGGGFASATKKAKGAATTGDEGEQEVGVEDEAGGDEADTV